MADRHPDLKLARDIGRESRGLVVVATTRPDGSVHASLVNAGVLDDPPAAAGPGPVVALVAAGGTRKLDLLRRSGRASVTFHHGWQWVSVEGPARIAGPDDPLAGLSPSELPELLRTVFRAAGGTHDDWDEFDRVMAAERRAAVLIQPARIITNRPG
jgi:PPOX class probable F420-dependent enzyme